jgi:indole-3-glycerol phosphate synthase
VDTFTSALRRAKGARQLAVIAEIKRTSPAVGQLASGMWTVAMQAHAYQAGGAAAISVLTEPRFWGGSLDDLKEARVTGARTPILCKDVIVDEYQILEARAAGADAVLLIAEALDDEALARLRKFAASLSMGTLVEAHEATAFGRAVASGSAVVGINARDLRDPKTLDIGRVRQLHSFVREDQVLVAESGINGPDDVRLLPRRVDAVLVGTALMRAADPIHIIKQLRAARGPVAV